MSPDEPSELAAILEGTYWNFLHVRLARRRGERGKVHGRSFRTFAEVVHEIADADGGVPALEAALGDLERSRDSIEHEVLENTGMLDVKHEWLNFVARITEFVVARSMV